MAKECHSVICPGLLDLLMCYSAETCRNQRSFSTIQRENLKCIYSMETMWHLTINHYTAVNLADICPMDITIFISYQLPRLTHVLMTIGSLLLSPKRKIPAHPAPKKCRNNLFYIVHIYVCSNLRSFAIFCQVFKGGFYNYAFVLSTIKNYL